MLSENQRIRGLISSVIDIVLLIAAYLLANFLRFNWLPFFEEGGAGPALDIARSPMVALDRKSTRLNSSHWNKSRMPSSA